jgi:hypothetical protein
LCCIAEPGCTVLQHVALRCNILYCVATHFLRNPLKLAKPAPALLRCNVPHCGVPSRTGLRPVLQHGVLRSDGAARCCTMSLPCCNTQRGRSTPAPRRASPTRCGPPRSSRPSCSACSSSYARARCHMHCRARTRPRADTRTTTGRVPERAQGRFAARGRRLRADRSNRVTGAPSFARSRCCAIELVG